MHSPSTLYCRITHSTNLPLTECLSQPAVYCHVEHMGHPLVHRGGLIAGQAVGVVVIEVGLEGCGTAVAPIKRSCIPAISAGGDTASGRGGGGASMHFIGRHCCSEPRPATCWGGGGVVRSTPCRTGQHLRCLQPIKYSEE
jgi:hypothetical protein